MEKKIIIAGPCSVESKEQLEQSVAPIAQRLDYIRAGVWKPRSRPHHFEGQGARALPWLEKMQKDLERPICIEVASVEHVESSLKHNINAFWLGARTTVNPFLTKEILESLKGVGAKIFIKNPVSADLKLWIGAIERAHLFSADVCAIHRGFSAMGWSQYRNPPLWELPLALKKHFPDLPIICDPSHIAGKRHLVAEVSQMAFDFGMDGLMVEVHSCPEKALSDAGQQLTPKDFLELFSGLKIKKETASEEQFNRELEIFRDKLDAIDYSFLQLLHERMEVVKEIGAKKEASNVMPLQKDRFIQMLEARGKRAESLGLSPELIEKIFELIHAESLRVQEQGLDQNEGRR